MARGHKAKLKGQKAKLDLNDGTSSVDFILAFGYKLLLNENLIYMQIYCDKTYDLIYSKTFYTYAFEQIYL